MLKKVQAIRPEQPGLAYKGSGIRLISRPLELTPGASQWLRNTHPRLGLEKVAAPTAKQIKDKLVAAGIPGDVQVYHAGENATANLGDWHEEDVGDRVNEVCKKLFKNYVAPDESEIGRPSWAKHVTSSGLPGGDHLLGSKTAAARISQQWLRKAAQAIAPEQAYDPQPDRKPPTEAQARAGNYKKYSLPWQGFTVVLEQPVGSTRQWRSKDGRRGTTRYKAPYGYLRGIQGLDGDPLDVFLGPDLKSYRGNQAHARGTAGGQQRDSSVPPPLPGQPPIRVYGARQASQCSPLSQTGGPPIRPRV